MSLTIHEIDVGPGSAWAPTNPSHSLCIGRYLVNEASVIQGSPSRHLGTKQYVREPDRSHEIIGKVSHEPILEFRPKWSLYFASILMSTVRPSYSQ